jgi:hypothetical protein
LSEFVCAGGGIRTGHSAAEDVEHREISTAVSTAPASDRNVASEPTTRIDDASRSTERPVDRFAPKLEATVAVVEDGDAVTDLARAIANAAADKQYEVVRMLTTQLARILSAEPMTAGARGSLSIAG